MSIGHHHFAHGRELLHQQQEVARLQGLLEASRVVHGTIELAEVLQCTLEVAAKELESEGAFFAETEAFTADATYGRVPFGWPQSNDSRVWTDCTHVPLWDKNRNLLTRLVIFRPGQPLSLEEQDFLEGLALQASVAIENARHHKQLLAWERTQQDLASARVIQRSLLPQTLPQIPGYFVSYQFSPCHEVGGDYVDIIPLDSHCFVAIVADIAGKGLASALVSAAVRATFRAMVTAGVGLPELADRMNDLHHAEGPEARYKYATAIMVRLDARHHELTVVNAGHNPGFLLSGTGPRLLGASGPPLGLFPNTRYQAETYSLVGSCGLLLYTDGLTEVFRGEEEFGSERLLAEFQQLHTRRCSDTLHQLWSLVAGFSGSGEQSDDMTALALLRNAEVAT
ncbi:MAG: PP2C family protein-serine/threonine phosphatase [Acidobacteriaceae bacterium]|nr:PP2C family protein-serine/threonine phosphatase [Acidobacteriaceae bacterium]